MPDLAGAIQRELQEETGLRVERGQEFGASSLLRITSTRERDTFVLSFLWELACHAEDLTPDWNLASSSLGRYEVAGSPDDPGSLSGARMTVRCPATESEAVNLRRWLLSDHELLAPHAVGAIWSYMTARSSVFRESISESSSPEPLVHGVLPDVVCISRWVGPDPDGDAAERAASGDDESIPFEEPGF